MKEWLKAAGIRAIKTIIETFVAAIGTTAIIYEIDWKTAIITALLSGCCSILMSIATGLPELSEETEEIEDDI